MDQKKWTSAQGKFFAQRFLKGGLIFVKPLRIKRIVHKGALPRAAYQTRLSQNAQVL
jgi:hypothetical protein